MKKTKLFLFTTYMILAIVFLCGCSNKKEDKILESRINSEVEYLDKKIIGVMNKLNNITLENYEVKSKSEQTKGQGQGRRKIKK